MFRATNTDSYHTALSFGSALAEFPSGSVFDRFAKRGFGVQAQSSKGIFSSFELDDTGDLNVIRLTAHHDVSDFILNLAGSLKKVNAAVSWWGLEPITRQELQI